MSGWKKSPPVFRLIMIPPTIATSLTHSHTSSVPCVGRVRLRNGRGARGRRGGSGRVSWMLALRGELAAIGARGGGRGPLGVSAP